MTRNPTGTRLGALALVAFALALAPSASASHVVPTFVQGPDNHTCTDFADGAAWLDLKVEPATGGTYSSGDDVLTVTMSVHGGAFDWVANAAIVVAVFVKDGDAGHFLYEYDPPEDGDTGLTTPGGGEGQISHVSFCYVVPPSCEDFPDMPECQPTCEDFPDMPECQPTCEDFPDMPECQPTCEDFPDMPECQPNCEDTPDMPECQPCPATVSAVAEADGSITVTVVAAGAFDLYRKAGDGSFELVGQSDGDTTYTDSDVTSGTVYTYQVRIGDEVCDEVMVTAIPDFPVAIGVMAAAALGAVGYAMMRRKQ